MYIQIDVQDNAEYCTCIMPAAISPHSGTPVIYLMHGIKCGSLYIISMKIYLPTFLSWTTADIWRWIFHVTWMFVLQTMVLLLSLMEWRQSKMKLWIPMCVFKQHVEQSAKKHFHTQFPSSFCCIYVVLFYNNWPSIITRNLARITLWNRSAKIQHNRLCEVILC